MSSGCSAALALTIAAGCAAGAELRVCADPNNLPFSNRLEQGFENHIAQILARDVGRQLRYVWTPQVGHFLKPLRSGECDLIVGLAAASTAVPLTKPYYRSSYVLLSRTDRRHIIRSLDDPALRTARIGVQTPGADRASSPAGMALARRGLIANVAWYRLVQTYATPNDAAVLVEAVADGDVDTAIAWGPVAGYYARRATVPLVLTPLALSERSTPMAFDIAMGVRPGDADLLRTVNASLSRRKLEIRRVLERFGVPLVAGGKQ